MATDHILQLNLVADEREAEGVVVAMVEMEAVAVLAALLTRRYLAARIMSLVTSEVCHLQDPI